MKKSNSELKPQNSILFVSEKGIENISSNSINNELVGEKAYGLSCLPLSWTLPYFVISKDLFEQYKKAPTDEKIIIVSRWVEYIQKASAIIGFHSQDEIIIRSSGCMEGMEERGKYFSIAGSLGKIAIPLQKCLEKLEEDSDCYNKIVPLIVQKYICITSAKGHLSNERRFYYDKRDWVGEYETPNYNEHVPFSINLRNWRKKINPYEYSHKELSCNLIVQLTKILQIPASFVTDNNLRIHYEWIWDGNTIYIVQADQEKESTGESPLKLFQYSKQLDSNFTPKCLKMITPEHSIKFNKIHNVYTYQKLNLPIAKLYVLDDQEEIKKVSLGKMSLDLEDDIKELVKGSLVIRMDIDTDNMSKRQLLPRTQEERNFDNVSKWLQENINKIRGEIQENIIFIFHNFIPSVSSAFAYAEPNHRFVKIEALWGLPEGLYYNSHDQYIVDTNAIKLEKMDKFNFSIKETCNYKRYFVSPDIDGNWTSKALKDPFDWKSSIQNEEWVKEIAYQSRRIAEEEGKALSIMWFVEVPKNVCSNRVFPWYHEECDYEKIKNQPYHPKTPFDQTFLVQTNKDIEVLKSHVNTNIKCIQIQPKDDAMIRDKHTLRKIGELAKQIDATILLEGGILSHAYYQLVETKAVVEVKHPFGDNENKREFNKLVRDEIPSTISHNGEKVYVGKLEGEYLLRALRQKLIEESFEVLDALDEDSILSELADVSEVIDGILSNLNLTKQDLEIRQRKKKDRVGGFSKGLVLLKTLNPENKVKNRQFEDIGLDDFDIEQIQKINVAELEPELIKRSDKKEYSSSKEDLTKLLVPMILDNWKTELKDKDFILNLNNNSQINIKGVRKGAIMQIEISIFRSHEQLSLLDEIETNSN